MMPLKLIQIAQRPQGRFAEQGRSMVEILGTLSIMGILSLVGLKMYHSAVNSHRANELIYEANKRATMVAAQLMAGRSGDQLSIAEFTDPAGYHFGVETNPKNTNQFNITIDAVGTDVCQKIKNLVDEGTIIRVISDFCDKLTYNNDLSRSSYTTDYAKNESACGQAGYHWCAKGDNIVVPKCSENANCCTGISYHSQCQICDTSTGEITNQSGSCTYTYANGSTATGTCDSGMCLNPSITTSTKCLTNDDCGGVGSGYYCNYSSTDSNTNCTEDGITAVGCNGGTVANCTKAGTCTRIGGITYAQVSALGQLSISANKMNWWSAKNWCQAQNKNLIPVEEFQVYKSGTALLTANSTTVYSCKKEFIGCVAWVTTGMWKNARTLTDAQDNNGVLWRSKYSPVVIELAQQLKGIKDNHWLASNRNAANLCSSYCLYLATSGMNDCVRTSTSNYALCQ